jgi:hypothetical protein
VSQRDSGYARKDRDLYETPEWVTRALLPHIPGRVRGIWEPAAGGDMMAQALRAAERQFYVIASDIYDGMDFLKEPVDPPRGWGNGGIEAIITNPPYELATAFIEHAIRMMARPLGMVAMLLRTDFDHAKTRVHLFGECPAFAKKLVLTKRIRWFEDSKGSPSFNHAWFIWDWKHQGAPTLAYGP